ncbi:MAG: GNAT family N-acetyltransferase, partial [Bacteroidales bacterium]
MEIIRYNTSFREDWNHFVRSSRNGTFLFEREYMEYHADRFTDHSLLFYKQGKIKGVLPANEQGNRLFSHQGLTYGGLVMGPDTLSVDVEMIFAELIPYLKEQNIDSLVYKMIPAIYWKQPAAEDAYFLFRMHAQKIACALSSTINLHSLLPYNRERKRAVRRATDAGLFILETTDMNLFWPVMEENMERR